MYDYQMFGPGFGIGLIITIIIWALIIWAIIAIVRAIAGRHEGNYGHHGWGDRFGRYDNNNRYDRYGREDQAMMALRERYARGEISKEEFEMRKKDLEIR